MKIVQVLLHDGIGGAETLAARLADEWVSTGIESHTIYVDPQNTLGRLARLRRVRRELKALAPDVVLSHSALPNLYSRLAWSRTPVMTVLHSADDDFANPVLRGAERLLRVRHRHVIAVSAAQADRYARWFGVAARPRVIPNGIGHVPEAMASEALAPARVVTVARVASQKDPRLWLATVVSAETSLPRLSFEWWGPVVDAVSAAVVAEARDTGRRAVFLGATDDPLSVFAGADLYFHPALREAHSVAILEAAACGLPVVCSDQVARTLPDGLPVATFRAGDAGDAVDALTAVCAAWEEAQTHATRRKDEIRREYSMEKCAQSYATLAATLVGTLGRARIAS